MVKTKIAKMITKYDDFLNENSEFSKTPKGKTFLQEIIKFLTEKHGKSIEEAQGIVKKYFGEIGEYFLVGQSAKGVALKLFQETQD